MPSEVTESTFLHPATAASSGGFHCSEQVPGVLLSLPSVTDVCYGSQVCGKSLPASLPTDNSVSDMVSREMLCDIVRSAFHQSLEQQLRHEQLLRQDFGRRSKGEVRAVLPLLPLLILYMAFLSTHSPGSGEGACQPTSYIG